MLIAPIARIAIRSLVVPILAVPLVIATLAAAQDAGAPPTEAVSQDAAGTSEPAATEAAAPEREAFEGTPAELAATYDTVTLRSIGKTFGGRDLQLLSVGDPDATWAALIVAGLHGRRGADESAVALDVAAWLAEHSEELPANTLFHVLADGSPDASAATAPSRAGNDRSIDDDGDGDLDEDGADDLNGDGEIGWMRIPDPTGEWAFDNDGVPVRAEPAKGTPRTHRIVREGRDDDADGKWNEDGPGGVDIARNFTWSFEEHTRAAGAWPASESTTRAIMDFILAEQRIALVYEFGAAETITKNPGWDGAWKKLPDDDGDLLTGLREMHAKGADVKRSASAPGNGSLGATVWNQLGRIWLGRAPLGRSGPVWPDGDAKWPQHLTVTWSAVSGDGVPDGAEVATITPLRTDVGDDEPDEPDDADDADDADDEGDEGDEGDEEDTVKLPPSIFAETPSIGGFLRDVAAARAVVAFTETFTAGSDGVLRLRTRLVNTGRLPTHTARGAQLRARRPLNVRVVLPDGATLAGGRPLVQIERLAPGGASDELAWVVAGKSGDTVKIEVSGPDLAPIAHEVRIP